MKRAEAQREVARLVKKLDALTKREFKKYDEENTKKDFILPLFRALGWAVEDRREVTAEDKVSRRRVDYAFRIEGIPKFFLEAKRLKADLDNPKYGWQAINYAWTKGVTWAVLTDFEGLKVYNAQWKGPSLLYNRFLNIPYTEYLERFDQLWLLSRRSFEESLLDIEAEKVAKKAKREAVGKELFDDLIVWRQRLYRQLRGWKENKRYSAAQIDEAVQRILDRFIFIRTAEDRELEERVLLPAVREWRENGRRKELDNALVRIFRQFDEKYDSELFEVGHFCEDLVCDSTTYARVIEGLYGMRDEVPTYNFDAIDVDVLGGIYEQYLSYRQGLPEEVEEAKRRRRKKRGIYYTPKFVVQYIVENTIGRLLQERSHDQIRKLRILDPACGSGSFLIEAFDRLDRYHQEARGTAQRSDEKAAQDDFLERLRILRDNIYGVDLDPQAVEIARLNLLLKTLHRRALLPKLEDNIHCGNSLISGLPIELSQYFGADWEAKRPFNWEEEFPKIMEEGGFDIVIGNPPYLGFHGFKDEKLYYRDHFESAIGRFDLYIPFIEQGMRLLKDGGLFGYICPTNFMKRQHGKALRRLLKDTCQIEEIVDFGHSPVFGEALNYTCILIMRKGKAESHSLRYFPDGLESQSYLVNQDSLSSTGWTFISPEEAKLVERIERAPSLQLGELTEGIFEGIVTAQNSVFVLSKDEAKRHRLERDLVRPAVQGRQIQRYYLEDPANVLLYPYRPVGGKAEVIPEAELESKYPLAYQYLESKREDLSGRSYFDDSGKVWYELWNERNFANQAVSKIVVRELAPSAKFALAAKDQFYLDTVVSIIPKDRSRQKMLYILGLLNSRLLEHYYKKITVPKAGGFYIYKTMFLRRLPIRRIDFDNPQDVKMHDDLVALVERMLDLHKRLKDAKGEEKKNLERRIARTDRKIDNLVYQLYDITEEERKIIEGRM